MRGQMQCRLLCWGACLAILLFQGGAFGQDDPHECLRRCDENYTEPRTCVYDFTVEWYLTMSKACYDCPFVEEDCYRPHCIPGDGNRKAVVAINRQYPGPTIEVCEGDTIVVHVLNHLANGEGTTIHWHGIHQKGTPYMDGTNMVTQCPISEKSNFTYEFEASPSGTHIYHAHTGLQMADGLFGPLIVHSYVMDNPHYDLYDHDCDTPHYECEHHVAVNDWMTTTFVERWATLNHNSFDNQLPISSLINGKMQRYAVQNEYDPEDLEFTPYEVFEVEQGKRYRFRLTGEVHMACAFKVSIDGHNLQVIAADGRPVRPTEVEAIILFSGERYDFVVTANQGSGNFWFKAHATNFCMRTSPNAYAIFRYSGAPAEDPPGDKDLDRGEGYLLQPILGTTNPDDLKYQHGEPYDINVDDLDNTADEDFTDEVVDDTYYLTLSMLNNDNSRYHHPEYYPQDGVAAHKRSRSAVIDNITFLIPPVPILSQPGDVDGSLLCDRSTVNHADCMTDLCQCVHTLAFEENRVVELIILNDGIDGHPMHMHGYAFRMLGTERIGAEISMELIKEMNENGELKKKLINPSYRDTVTVHSQSYVVFRFVADNPGYWLLHCHVTDHLDSGQILLMQIGQHEDLPPVPEGFPQCGDWKTIEARMMRQQQEQLDQEMGKKHQEKHQDQRQWLVDLEKQRRLNDQASQRRIMQLEQQIKRMELEQQQMDEVLPPSFWEQLKAVVGTTSSAPVVSVSGWLLVVSCLAWVFNP